MGVVMRETRVVEQPIAERYLSRILDRRKRDRRDRLLVGAGLRSRGLRNRRARTAKDQHDQEQARYTSANSRGASRQSQAVARGRHGQFTIQ